MNTELVTYLKNEKGLSIISTASSLKRMLKKYQENPSPEQIKKTFKNFIAKRNDEEINITNILMMIQDDEKIKKFCNTSSLGEILECIVKEVITSKESTAESISLNKRLSIENKGLTPYKEKLIDNIHYEYELVNLFDNNSKINPNKADINFYSCFKITGSNVIYADGNKSTIIFQKENGILDFNNELNCNTENPDNLYLSLDKNFGAKYVNYITLLKTFLIGVSKDDIEEAYESKIPLIEDAFINGFKIGNESYQIPASFRKFIDVYIRWKSQKEDEVTRKYFDGFIMRPNKKFLPTLEFDNFLDYFSKYFRSLTKGCIQYIKDWKVFSNNINEFSIIYYPLPKDYEKATLPISWKKFFYGEDFKHPKASNRLLIRVFYFIGSCLDANNKSQQMLLISDAGGTGKSELIKLLQKILPEGMMKPMSNSAISNTRFGVTSHGLYNAHILFNTEYDGTQINNELMKSITGGDTITCEVKGGANIIWNAEGTKLIFTSNRKCFLKEHAIRRRIIPVSFVMNYDFLKGFSDEFRKSLIDEGHNFLRFCFRIYKNCKYKNSYGDFIVMNKEQQDNFEKNGIPSTSDEISNYFMKAISKDEEIKNYFEVGDYDENGANDDLNEFYDMFFEYDENSDIPVKEFKEYIQNIFNRAGQKTTENRYVLSFMGLFDFDKRPDGSLILKVMSSTHNRIFKKFMEDTKGHKYNVFGKYGDKKVVKNLKLKEDIKTEECYKEYGHNYEVGEDLNNDHFDRMMEEE